MKKKTNKIEYITQIALYSAFIVVASKLEIRIYDTRIHFGNSMCLFSGLILSPLYAGLSSGLGSLIFDLLFYPSSFAFNLFFTFINKFALAFFCSLCFNKLKKIELNKILILILSGLLGQVSYIVLYLFKVFIEKHFFYKLNLTVVLTDIFLKAITSSLNAIIAIIVSTFLFLSLRNKIKYLK